MKDLPDPDIVESPGRRFVGLMDRFDMTRCGEIPALYERFFARRDAIEGAVEGALYGLSLDAKPDGSFHYAVAVEVPAPGAMPEGFCALEAAAWSQWEKIASNRAGRSATGVRNRNTA